MPKINVNPTQVHDHLPHPVDPALHSYKNLLPNKSTNPSSSTLFAHGVEAAAGTAEARDAEGEEGEDGGPDDGGQHPAVVGAVRVQHVAAVAVLQGQDSIEKHGNSSGFKKGSRSNFESDE